MGLFGQPGDSLGKKKWDNMTDQERKRLFYRDQARDRKLKEKAERKLRKAQAKTEKMERQRQDWERKAKWLAARNKLEQAKRERRKHSVLMEIARRI